MLVTGFHVAFVELYTSALAQLALLLLFVVVAYIYIYISPFCQYVCVCCLYVLDRHAFIVTILLRGKRNGQMQEFICLAPSS